MSSPPRENLTAYVDPAGKTAETDRPRGEDVDVWWGSYSSLTLLPSSVGCLVVAVVIAWGCWYLQIRGFARLAFLGAACLVCVLQFVRLANRVFGYNYRLTRRWLFCERRFMARSIVRVDLRAVARVDVERTGVEQLLGVGRVRLTLDDPTQPAVVLEGVRDAERVANAIRAEVKRSRSG